MKSLKQNTYDSYQRFEVSKIAVLDSGFRRTKKPFEAEVFFLGRFPIAPLWGESEDEGKITYQSFPINFGIKIFLVFGAFMVVRFSIQPALSQVDQK